MNIVLCENAENRLFTAGNKARTDTVKILTDYGYKHMPLFTSKSNRALVAFNMISSCFRSVLSAKKDETIFIQYPYYPFVVNKCLVNALCFGRLFKHYSIKLLIHDSMGLRNIEGNKKIVKSEIRLLNKVDVVICHNAKMSQFFFRNGGVRNYEVLGPFDYLYEGEMAKKSVAGEKTIVIAGNLAKEKCGYLYDINKHSNILYPQTH